MKKHIVITSIFDPTEAVIAFSKMKDNQLIVVGDKKTPQDWNCDKCVIVMLNTIRKTLQFPISGKNVASVLAKLSEQNFMVRAFLYFIMLLN